jgi:hypothetical protein
MLVSGSISRAAGQKTLTLISIFNRVPIVMKRLASLFLLLVLAGSAFAGVPLHFGESECGMDGMMDMDCCKAALLQEETPKVADAKLCCALYCAQNGTTSPPNAVRVTPPSPARTPFHALTTGSLPSPSLRFEPIDRLHGPPGSAAPVYLRNLALLI